MFRVAETQPMKLCAGLPDGTAAQGAALFLFSLGEKFTLVFESSDMSGSLQCSSERFYH